MSEPQTVAVRWLSERVTKGTTPTTLGRAYTSHGVRFLKVETFADDGTYIPGREAFIDETTNQLLRRSQLAEDDILFSIAGALGRSTMVERLWLPANINQALAIIRPRKRGKCAVDPRYLLWALRSPHIEHLIAEINVQAAQANLSLEQIRDFAIPVVPLVEQRAVVDALEDVSRLIASLERVASKKRAIKLGLMQELLTGRIRIPGFSEPWQLIRLGDHVSYVKNVALSRAQLDSSSPLRYLHYGDIHARPGSVLDASMEDMPRASRVLARNAELLQVGDLVFADASEDADGVGKSVEITGIPIDGAIPGLHTIAARFDKRVLADGFKGYLQFIVAFRRQLLALAAGTKVLATTRAYISRIELSLPGVSEQLAIAEVLRDADADVQALERRLEATRAIKRGMMQELLTGRTRLAPPEAPA